MPIRLPPTAGQALRNDGRGAYRRLSTVPARMPPAPSRSVSTPPPAAPAPAPRARPEALFAPPSPRAPNAGAGAGPDAPPLWRRSLNAVGRVLAWPFAAAASITCALGAAVLWVWHQIVDDADDEGEDGGGTASPWRRERSFAELHLSAANEEQNEKECNRNSYLAAMRRPGTWGSELELHVLAERAQVRAQVWRVEDGPGGEAYVCCATAGAQDAPRVVNLKLVSSHYSALLVANGEERCEAGARRALTNFRRTTIPADGDCQFLAFAYAADLPYARRLLDYINDDGRGPAGALAADQALLQHFGLNDADLTDDDAVAGAALAELVARQRSELVAQLNQPTYFEQIDMLVVQELAERGR